MIPKEDETALSVSPKAWLRGITTSIGIVLVIVLIGVACGPEPTPPPELIHILSPTPTATPVPPYRLPPIISIERSPLRLLEVDEARKVLRDQGCLECSTVLAEAAENSAHRTLVALGDFYGADGLNDVVMANYVAEVYHGDLPSERFEDIHSVYENNGTTLVERHSTYRFIFSFMSGKRHENWLRNDNFFDGRPYHLIQWQLVRTSSGLFWSIYRSSALRGTNPGQAVLYNFEEDEWLSVGGKTDWFGDFDNDGDIEWGVVDSETPIIVREVGGDESPAQETITLATRDFAANLLTDNESDFEALWREHGSWPSLTALAILTRVDDLQSYHSRLQQDVSSGLKIYEAAKRLYEERE